MNNSMNKKALKIVDKYIKKAENYKARKGYKENLGYEYRQKVMDEIGRLGLGYCEECEIMNYFEYRCDEL